jgi:tetratricopeptide (TPR) repeat protein
MRNAADLDPVSSQLAAHYEQAGLLLAAIGYYQRAGAVAQRVYANAEAISLYNRANALLVAVPDGRERARSELAIQIALVVPLAIHAGYGAPALLTACRRARHLAEQLGVPPDPSVLRALAVGSIGRRWFGEAQEFGEQLLALAKDQAKDQPKDQSGDQQDPILLTEAYYVLGVTSFYQAQFVRARRQLEAAIDHYGPANSSIHIARYAQDPKVVCQCRLALVLWYLGYPDQAEQMGEAALSYARQLGHPFSLVYCLYWNAMVQQHRGNPAAMLERIATGLEVIGTHQLGTFSHWMASLQGWALAEAGNFAGGIAHLQRSIDLAGRAGTQNLESFNLGAAGGTTWQTRPA